MKRTGFKQKGYEPRQSRQVEEPNPGVTSPCSVQLLHRGVFNKVEVASTLCVPKHIYIRSPALLAAVRTLPCMHTGLPGPSDPAHSNWTEWGHKGKGVKADDNRIAALSRVTHRELDQGSKLSENERRELWWKAHCKTVTELLKRGLWPADVPIPDLRRLN